MASRSSNNSEHYELITTSFRPEDFPSSGMSFLMGALLDDFLMCPCSESFQHCSDLADLGEQTADHSLSLKEETTRHC